MFARRATMSELLLGTEPEREFLRTTQERTAVPATPPPAPPPAPPRPPPSPRPPLPPAEQRANDMIEGIAEGLRRAAPGIRVPPAPFKRRSPGGKRWRGKATKENSLVWRKNTLRGPMPRLCRVLEKRNLWGKQMIGADGSKKQVFDDKDNIGVLDLQPLTEDRGCDRHELDGVHHNTVVPLVNGLEQLLATPENKLGEQLQLQLRAALAHLATLYGDGPSPPQWLPGVREDITSALAR